MNEPLVVRRATDGDAEALARLKLVTFRETFVEDFAVPYPPADLAVFEAEAYGMDKVLAELRDLDKATWVAQGADGDLLGYAHVGPTKLPHPDARGTHGELYQLYVRRGAQGLKLGGRLLGLALEHLETTRPGPTWLGVWSGNLRAQAIYAARGFEKVGEYRFPVGAWFDEEFIFRRPG